MRLVFKWLDRLVAKAVNAVTAIIDRRIEERERKARVGHELIKQALLDTGMHDEAKRVDEAFERSMEKLKSRRQRPKRKREDPT